ncbi:MAG TPA: hypothetical protein VD883_01715, partial [Candidatus Omnitrophota bacterium]|nr:hypothetical protein [Candidatus Omnitrophota bacterium]
MKSTLTNDREVFSRFVRHEELRRMRALFDEELGRPVWWVSFKLGDNPASLKNSIAESYHVWFDPRVRTLGNIHSLYLALKSRSKEMCPFTLKIPAQVLHFCVPLAAEGRVIGYLGLSGVKKTVSPATKQLLVTTLKLMLESCHKA